MPNETSETISETISAAPAHGAVWISFGRLEDLLQRAEPGRRIFTSLIKEDTPGEPLWRCRRLLVVQYLTPLPANGQSGAEVWTWRMLVGAANRYNGRVDPLIEWDKEGEASMNRSRQAAEVLQAIIERFGMVAIPAMIPPHIGVKQFNGTTGLMVYDRQESVWKEVPAK